MTSASLIRVAGLLQRLVRRPLIEVKNFTKHWWGVTPQTVSKWRKALSVGIATEGTSQLHRETIEQTGEAMRALSVLKARDPERRRPGRSNRSGLAAGRKIDETGRAAFGVVRSAAGRRRGRRLRGSPAGLAHQDNTVSKPSSPPKT
jgi:hypothetical protein